MRRVVVVLVVAACGDNARSPIAELADQYFDAKCAYFVRCGAASTIADCRDYFAPVTFDTPSFEAALEAGKIRLDPNAAKRCVAAYETISCDTTEQTAAELEPCTSTVTGLVKLGDPCAFHDECANGACNNDCAPGTCCMGTCVPLRSYPVLGEPCTAVCEDAYCGADYICHAYGVLGDSCDVVTPCGQGLECTGRGPDTPGACTPLPKDGEPCDGLCAEEASECISGVCAKPGLAGDACDDVQRCSQFYACVGGTCQVPAATPDDGSEPPLCY